MSIHSRDRWVRIYGTDVADWTLRHGLQPQPATCPCGAPAPLVVPFMVRGTALRGLTAEACACGHEWPPYCVVAPTMAEMFGGEG